MPEEDGIIPMLDVAVLLPASNCDLDKATWGLFLITVLIALSLDTTVDKVAFTRLALGDA